LYLTEAKARTPRGKEGYPLRSSMEASDQALKEIRERG
jgi:hypothetical protein